MYVGPLIDLTACSLGNYIAINMLAIISGKLIKPKPANNCIHADKKNSAEWQLMLGTSKWYTGEHQWFQRDRSKDDSITTNGN